MMILSLIIGAVLGVMGGVMFGGIGLLTGWLGGTMLCVYFLGNLTE